LLSQAAVISGVAGSPLASRLQQQRLLVALLAVEGDADAQLARRGHVHQHAKVGQGVVDEEKVGLHGLGRTREANARRRPA
jgi:hypothetical protein